MLLITRVHWPSSISLMTDPSGCWMLGKNPRWSIGLQLCANAVSTETRTVVSVLLVCHFMCLLWTHRDTKIQSWMFGPRVKRFHCWPANPLNFSTTGLLLRTPVHLAEGTLRNFCISYVYVCMFMRKCHELSGYLKFPVTAMMIFGKRIFFYRVMIKSVWSEIKWFPTGKLHFLFAFLYWGGEYTKFTG